MGETAFLATARLFLADIPGAFFIRINTGVFRPMYGPQNRRIRSAPNGTPDLMGRFCAVPTVIETKSLKGDQRKAQEDFEREWTRDGYGAYILAKTLEDICRGLKLPVQTAIDWEERQGR